MTPSPSRYVEHPVTVLDALSILMGITAVVRDTSALARVRKESDPQEFAQDLFLDVSNLPWVLYLPQELEDGNWPWHHFATSEEATSYAHDYYSLPYTEGSVTSWLETLDAPPPGTSSL